MGNVISLELFPFQFSLGQTLIARMLQWQLVKDIVVSICYSKTSFFNLSLKFLRTCFMFHFRHGNGRLLEHGTYYSRSTSTLTCGAIWCKRDRWNSNSIPVVFSLFSILIWWSVLILLSNFGYRNGLITPGRRVMWQTWWILRRIIGTIICLLVQDWIGSLLIIKFYSIWILM